MKKLFFAAAASFAMFIFTGCPGTTPPIKEPAAGLISEISGEGDRVTFTYDARNRLTHMAYDDGEVFSYAYPDASTIAVTIDGHASTYKLNASGYLETMETRDGKDLLIGRFSYQNHYLKAFYYEDFYGIHYAYAWQEGNLKSITIMPGHSVEFQYGEVANKGSIDLNYFLIGDMQLIAGLLGKPSAKLATGLTVNASGHSETTTFRYETNAEGYVTKIYATYDDEPEVSYTVKYK